MAKGNVLLGQMRGKVGDVLFKHVDGQQITSAVNHPSNPKTERQQYQRAIMATITRAYAAGSRIFDHSFQGLQTGAQNQAKFFKENCKILRQLMVEEVNAAPIVDMAHLSARARCVMPGSLSPVGFDGMLISDGTLPWALWSVEYPEVAPGRYTALAYELPTPESSETTAEYSRLHGIVADDYYTLLGFINYDQNQVWPLPLEDVEKTFYTGHFFCLRFHTKASFVNGSRLSFDSRYRDLFEVDSWVDDSGLLSLDALMASRLLVPLTIDRFTAQDILLNEYGGAWMGMIRSHKNDKIRSKSYLYRCYADERCGLTPNRVKEFWYDTPVTSINDPE